MNALSCQVSQLLIVIANVYSVILLIYAVLSWIPDLRGGWSRYLTMVVDPVLAPIRRVIPPMGGIDWSFLILILVLQFFIRPLLGHLEVDVCFAGY